MNILRRLPLWRLLLLCVVVLAAGASAAALALALDSRPTPPPKPLALAVHDALAAPAVQGISARVTLTDHLLEGAGLASEGGEGAQLATSPLLAGASGRLWIAADGRVRLELQAEKGDTQILYDGDTVSMYDAASNTLYRYTPPSGKRHSATNGAAEVPSLASIEQAISRLSRHADVSGATPTDVAGQPAYTVRISPTEGGSLIGGAELSFDAANGVPLRAAVYSSTSASPVIELAATDISYGPVEASVFEFTPPPSAKINELSAAHEGSASSSGPDAQRRAGSPNSHNDRPRLTTHGHGITRIAVLEGHASGAVAGASTAQSEALPKVKINGVSATELATSLGTVLDFERSGVRYVLLGARAPAAIEALARGL